MYCLHYFRSETSTIFITTLTSFRQDFTICLSHVCSTVVGLTFENCTRFGRMTYEYKHACYPLMSQWDKADTDGAARARMWLVVLDVYGCAGIRSFPSKLMPQGIERLSERAIRRDRFRFAPLGSHHGEISNAIHRQTCKTYCL